HHHHWAGIPRQEVVEIKDNVREHRRQDQREEQYHSDSHDHHKGQDSLEHHVPKRAALIVPFDFPDVVQRHLELPHKSCSADEEYDSTDKRGQPALPALIGVRHHLENLV